MWDGSFNNKSPILSARELQRNDRAASATFAHREHVLFGDPWQHNMRLCRTKSGLLSVPLLMGLLDYHFSRFPTLVWPSTVDVLGKVGASAIFFLLLLLPRMHFTICFCFFLVNSRIKFPSVGKFRFSDQEIKKIWKSLLHYLVVIVVFSLLFWSRTFCTHVPDLLQCQSIYLSRKKKRVWVLMLQVAYTSHIFGIILGRCNYMQTIGHWKRHPTACNNAPMFLNCTQSAVLAKLELSPLVRYETHLISRDKPFSSTAPHQALDTASMHRVSLTQLMLVFIPYSQFPAAPGYRQHLVGGVPCQERRTGRAL